jgi:hypothetical protein
MFSFSVTVQQPFNKNILDFYLRGRSKSLVYSDATENEDTLHQRKINAC